MFTAVRRQETLIVDLDMMFGSLPQYLDVQPKRGLLEALSVVRELDEVAIDAYLTRHSSGLRVLARSPESTPGSIGSEPAVQFRFCLSSLQRCPLPLDPIPSSSSRTMSGESRITLPRATRFRPYYPAGWICRPPTPFLPIATFAP